MRRLIRKLRDLDARLTSYGQCVRCRRSWRYASWVMVGFSLGSSYFCLCIRCYREEADKADAGLILQGWAARAMDDQATRPAAKRREILAAYGMAPRFPIELDRGWSSGPDTYRVRVIDERRRNRLGRADLSPTGEKAPPAVRSQAVAPDHVFQLGEVGPEYVAGFRAGVKAEHERAHPTITGYVNPDGSGEGDWSRYDGLDPLTQRRLDGDR